MSTIQLIGIGIAVVILILLIIALVVTRRRDRARSQAAAAPSLPVPPTAASSVPEGAPRNDLHRLQGDQAAAEEKPAAEEPPAVITTREQEAPVAPEPGEATEAPATEEASEDAAIGGPAALEQPVAEEQPAAGGGPETGPLGPGEAADPSARPATAAAEAALWNGGAGPTDRHQDEVDLWGRAEPTEEIPPAAAPTEPGVELSETTPSDAQAVPPDGTLIWTPASGIVGAAAAETAVEPAAGRSAETRSEADSARLAGPHADQTVGSERPAQTASVWEPTPEAALDLPPSVTEHDAGPAVVPMPEILDEPVAAGEPAVYATLPAVPAGGPAPAPRPEPASPPGGDTAPAERTPAGRREPRLVRLCDIIGTTNTQLVDLNDADVRRMLRELVQNEVDLAQQYKQLGQNVDAVLQLTEAQKICRALSMESHAKLLEQMIRELQV